MTKQEFWNQYKRLTAAFPDKFMADNPTKLSGLFEQVMDLDEKWLVSFVDRCIRVNDPNLDMVKAAIGERKAINSKNRTDEIIKKQDSLEVSDDALEKVLIKMGASSLVEAIDIVVSKNKQFNKYKD